MTPKQQQARRRELHAMETNTLQRLYANQSGRLISEVKADTSRMSDPRGFLIDLIVHREAHA